MEPSVPVGLGLQQPETIPHFVHGHLMQIAHQGYSAEEVARWYTKILKNLRQMPASQSKTGIHGELTPVSNSSPLTDDPSAATFCHPNFNIPSVPAIASSSSQLGDIPEGSMWVVPPTGPMQNTAQVYSLGVTQPGAPYQPKPDFQASVTNVPLERSASNDTHYSSATSMHESYLRAPMQYLSPYGPNTLFQPNSSTPYAESIWPFSYTPSQQSFASASSPQSSSQLGAFTDTPGLSPPQWSASHSSFSMPPFVSVPSSTSSIPAPIQQHEFPSISTTSATMATPAQVVSNIPHFPMPSSSQPFHSSLLPILPVAVSRRRRKLQQGVQKIMKPLQQRRKPSK